MTILFFQAVTAQHAISCQLGKTDTLIPNLSFNQDAVDFIQPVLAAASAFSELSGVEVEIQRRNIRTMMAARPKAGFLFKKKSQRKYVIIISDRTNMNAEELYRNMSSCAQMGVIGHELSHILCYESMSNLELLWFGIKYVFNKKQVEEETDLLAIRKGFGQQIIEFNQYLYKSPRTNKKYLKKKKKFYLTSYEIEQRMQEKL